MLNFVCMLGESTNYFNPRVVFQFDSLFPINEKNGETVVFFSSSNEQLSERIIIAIVEKRLDETRTPKTPNLIFCPECTAYSIHF